MNYPILRTSKAKALGEQIQQALELNPADQAPLDRAYKGFEKEIEYRKGAEWDQVAFDANVKNFFRNMSEDRKNGALTKLRMEEDFAEHFIEQMELVGDGVLQDPDFWRYLALFPYRLYVFQREGSFTPNSYGGDGNKALVRWTLIRGMLWGLRTVDPEQVDEERFWATYAYKDAREKAGFEKIEDTVPDFYISQIIRRRWSFNKDAYLGYIAAVIEPPVAIDEKGRDNTQFLGSRLGRLSENVYLPSLSREEIKSLVSSEKVNLPMQDPNVVA